MEILGIFDPFKTLITLTVNNWIMIIDCMDNWWLNGQLTIKSTFDGWMGSWKYKMDSNYKWQLQLHKTIPLVFDKYIINSMFPSLLLTN